MTGDLREPLVVGAILVVALIAAGALASLRLPGIRDRVRTWAVIAALFGGAMALGTWALIVVMAFVSFVALREYLSLAPTRREDRPALLVLYAMVPATYILVWLDLYGIWLVAIPVYAFLLMPAILVLNGRTSGYLAAAGILHFGLVIAVYALSHAAQLVNLPAHEAPAGGAGVLFFLLVATALNDVAQYVAGRAIGGPKILPTVSPNKTWAGFLGGWVFTAIFVASTAPLYTALPTLGVALLAVLLPLAGFAGDVTMSAVKRDLGVKDSSALLPGHGGMLDRVDSLTFTAPITFHIIAYFASERF